LLFFFVENEPNHPKSLKCNHIPCTMYIIVYKCII
jgi:hypothetical protein